MVGRAITACIGGTFRIKQAWVASIGRESRAFQHKIEHLRKYLLQLSALGNIFTRDLQTATSEVVLMLFAIYGMKVMKREYIENCHSYGEMFSHCNVPSRGATGNFSKFASPRLVWKAVRRELQQGYFSMDRNIAWADCTASCRCSGLKGSSEKYILWKERSKLENNSFSAKKCIFGCSRSE